MKILELIGASGCGKTTLAKKLEKNNPESFYRIVEYSTRDKRENEIDGFDYKFIDKPSLLVKRTNSELLESVVDQFFPEMYGADIADLSEDKTNVLVVSIEGLLSTIANAPPLTEHYILNIIVDDDETQREGRNISIEKNYNNSVLRTLFDTSSTLTLTSPSSDNIVYKEINLSKLKKIRNNPTKLKKYITETFGIV